ncbi:MAG: hypothetical protein ACRDI3_01795 [Actinomycetota bacterium]
MDRVCYGYRVTGRDLVLPVRSGDAGPLLLRDADRPPIPNGDPVLEIRSHEGIPFARVYRDRKGYAVWISDAGWFAVDPEEPSIALPPDCDPALLEARLWAVPIALCMIERGDLPFHAAAVEVDGSALVLAAPTKHGKTTLAAAFARQGFRVLSEDVTCCRVDQVPSILPGPAFLRVRRDSFERLRLSSQSVVREEGDRFYVTMDESPRGDGEAVPLSGILLIRPSAKRFALEPVSGVAALPDLWALTLNLPSTQGRNVGFSRLASLVDRVPVWDLHRPDGFDILDRIVEQIAESSLTGAASEVHAVVRGIA